MPQRAWLKGDQPCNSSSNSTLDAMLEFTTARCSAPFAPPVAGDIPCNAEMIGF